MITVLIVDDQPLIREGLAALLNLRSEIEVIGMESNGLAAYESSLEMEPDIVLMDIRMPGTNGVEGTRLITSQLPNTKVLMLTTFQDSELIFSALEEGASGYLLKDMSADMITNAIKTVQSGGVVLPPEITAQMLQELKRKRETKVSIKPAVLKNLTKREYDVLRNLGYGKNNKEIAATLSITEGTVKNHVSNIISKLELRDRTQAAVFAVRYRITTFSE
ncbi:response regulator [Peribacillus sp. NPDC096540]|uniref:response regulator n=1 Tax=Peribacillus sp. NPDC096540 TaxID=3390612 RepID=UPI003D07A0A2